MAEAVQDFEELPVDGAVDEAEEGLMRIGKRVFVSNLAWRTSWQDLKDKFREVGNVVYANVMRDDDGRSKGWGIVEFETPEEAVAAVNTLNGIDLGGRKIMVREDREDRDVKQYNKENGVRPAEGEGGGEGRRRVRVRKPRGEGRGGGRGGGGGGEGGEAREPRPPRPPREALPPREENSSGLQVVVQGIPWKYTGKELEDLFVDVGTVEQAEVVFAADGRSRGYGTVRFSSLEEASKAIADFHGTQLEGRTLTVFLDKYA